MIGRVRIERTRYRRAYEGVPVLHTRLRSARVAPRTILYTGKGGVGKTSVAAATARRCAAAGRRTHGLLDRPRALARRCARDVALGGEPTQIADGLWGQQVSAQEEMERNWSAVQDWLGDMLVRAGVDRISAEELTVPPGLDELFSLLQLKRHHESRTRWTSSSSTARRPARRCGCSRSPTSRAGGWRRSSRSRAGSWTRRARSPARCSTSQLPGDGGVRRGPAARGEPRSRWTRCCATASACRSGSS